MKLPRNVAAADLIRALGKLGYQVTRQSGSHVRLTLSEAPQHHLTIPAHATLKAGTLAAILREVAHRLGCDRDDLMRRIGL